MFKKILIGVLVVTVLGSAGAALAYRAATQDAEVNSTDLSPLGNWQGAGVQQAANQSQAGGSSSVAQPAAQGAEGEPWYAKGTIAAIDDYGFDFTLENGETVYIELGPPDYWQGQGIELTPGVSATVSGGINDGMIHASQVELANEQILQVRNESGQPLWSGGVSNNRGQNAGQGDGEHTPDPQAQVDEWITVEGTLMPAWGSRLNNEETQALVALLRDMEPQAPVILVPILSP